MQAAPQEEAKKDLLALSKRELEKKKSSLRAFSKNNPDHNFLTPSGKLVDNALELFHIHQAKMQKQPEKKKHFEKLGNKGVPDSHVELVA